MDGAVAEEEIGKTFLKERNIPQKTTFRKYLINEVTLNTKLTIGGKPVSENDVNVILKRDSWIVNSFNRLFYLRDSENFAVQSKAHQRRIGYGYASHDVINLLMTKIISYNLEAGTLIIKENGKSILEEKLKAKYKVPVFTEDKLGNYYGVIKKIGNNKLNFKKYKDGSWKHQSIKLGELTVLDEGSFFRKLKLVNIIYVDEINKENYNRIDSALDAEVTYLNHSRYAYVTPEGVEPKGAEFIKRMNGKVVNLETLDNILKKGKLLKEFKKINYFPFGIGKEVLGRAESVMYELIKEKGNFDTKDLTNAITYFLTKHHHIRY